MFHVAEGQTLMRDSEDFPKIPGPAVADVAPPGEPTAINPAALTAGQLARALGVSAETIHRHVADGAPAGADGRLNLIHYAAWLNSRLARAGNGEDGRGD